MGNRASEKSSEKPQDVGRGSRRACSPGHRILKHRECREKKFCLGGGRVPRMLLVNDSARDCLVQRSRNLSIVYLEGAAFQHLLLRSRGNPTGTGLSIGETTANSATFFSWGSCGKSGAMSRILPPPRPAPTPTPPSTPTTTTTATAATTNLARVRAWAGAPEAGSQAAWLASLALGHQSLGYQA